MKKTLGLLCILAPLFANAATVNYTPAKCSAVQRTVDLLKTFRTPREWSVVVVCNPQAWEHYRARFDSERTDAAFTLRSQRITLVNAAIYDTKPESLCLFILAHELGHLICACDEESKANKEAEKLLREK